MFQKLVNHNDDLKRLVDERYAVGFDTNCMVIEDIPYLDEKGNLKMGAIVTKLVFVNNDKVEQNDHQIFFAGGVPHGKDGKPISNLGGGNTNYPLSENYSHVVVERSFSNKPKNGKFKDFHHKINSYMSIISGPAMDLHDVTPFTCRINKSVKSDGIFKIQDTLTTRASIMDLSKKFENEVVAVIGLGGTGAYVLDHLVKTPVKEIRGFDRKPFRVHNVYRSPGKFNDDELGKPKAEVYQGRYENLREGLNLQAKYIDLYSKDELNEVTFAFVCVDNGSARADIFDLLISKKIPFIDVGMGLKRKGDGLNGMIRTTYYPVDRAQEMRDMDLCDLSDNPDDIYKTNIQIGELNSLNANLAVIKYKQIRGFYVMEDDEYGSLFEVSDSRIVGSSHPCKEEVDDED